ncbi:hypothetical protein EPUS_07786 [Endocarpon pusillum Z07020]|uniref:Glutaredoxin domain-containing protein n=1 Tax=Endocarpon pusillum (strain Z07020 / HMAS-L-300199) TaxID=1263415 RepID=U1HPX8_ENDPU|nr:uncharacterized protein EPUS_07786 [Endocarpon pusillum Z07020]ERF71114.1 hypothetical protein EPUS_07786 [Endocarpon pusillum Z07020]
MADITPKSYSADSTLYLYTSLTAGSSHIITATSRLETILKANKIPFRALDVATDEKARMLWGRRSKGKKLPGLVKYGSIVGDLEEIEEWNEYGELRQQIGSTPVAAPTPTASATNTPSKASASPIPVSELALKTPSDMPSPSPLSKETSEQFDSSPMSASRKGETPLTMAMRQAGAEAAKRAGEKKGSKSTAPISARDLEATEMPMPAIETKMARSVEEPGISANTAAAKIPEKLAEEGAKRTSVDKIAEEDAKRTNTDQVTNSDGKNEQKDVDLSKEATMTDASRAGSMPKVKSPLSEETAATSSTNLDAAGLGPGPRTHRGSSVSLAPKEQIEEIEKRNTILEETGDTDESRTKVAAQDRETSFTSMAGEGKRLEQSASATVADLKSTDEGEAAAMRGIQPQEQDAKDPEGAGASVGD